MPNDNPSQFDHTETLVDLAIQGDQMAMSALYTLYESRMKVEVKKRAGHQLRGQFDSSDLIQSVWGDVLDEMDQFEYRGPESFFNWLVIRLVRKIQTKARYLSREKRNPQKVKRLKTDLVITSKPIVLPAPVPTPSQVAISRERMEKFSHILSHFPETHRKILIYRLRDELDYDEIARRIGKSYDATRMLYGRCLKKLVDHMQDSGSSKENFPSS
ncbi:MAG: sigma-70 family RNA polymerase sigma factor [Planctomycetota bacterium]